MKMPKCFRVAAVSPGSWSSGKETRPAVMTALRDMRRYTVKMNARAARQANTLYPLENYIEPGPFNSVSCNCGNSINPIVPN